jgi:hypothetical protein
MIIQRDLQNKSSQSSFYAGYMFLEHLFLEYYFIFYL